MGTHLYLFHADFGTHDIYNLVSLNRILVSEDKSSKFLKEGCTSEISDVIQIHKNSIMVALNVVIVVVVVGVTAVVVVTTVTNSPEVADDWL